MDDRILKIGIPVVSTCNFCSDRIIKTLDHALSTGLVTRSVWKKVALSFDVFNTKAKPWRVKVHRCFRGATNSSLIDVMLGVTIVIIAWRLWSRRCKVRLKDKLESIDSFL